MRRPLASLAVLAGLALGARAWPAWGQIRTGDSDTGVGMGVIEEDPEKVREEIRLRCEVALEKAAKQIADAKPSEAWATLKSCRSLAIDSYLAQWWKDLVGQVNQAAAAMLQQAEEAYGKAEYAKAVKGCQFVANAYAGLPAAKAARDKLRQIEADPAAQAALLEDRAATMFQLVEATLARQREKRRVASGPASRPAETVGEAGEGDDLEVLKGLDDEKILETVDLLANIVKACTVAPTARKAAGWLEQLGADPAVKVRLATLRVRRKARQELGMATAYHQAGLLDKAAAMYRELLKSGPEEAIASEARKGLAAVEAEGGTR